MGGNVSHHKARTAKASAEARLAKHFSGDPEWQLQKEEVLRLQREIELAEIHLDEPDEEIEDWNHGDLYD